jgi:hypothetical protein
VARKIVPADDVPGMQLREQNALDIDFESGAVHQTVQHKRRNHAVTQQTCHER